MADLPTREPWFTFHPLSAEDRPLMAAFRASVGPNKGKLRGTAARAPFEAIMSGIIAPEDVRFREDRDRKSVV